MKRIVSIVICLILVISTCSISVAALESKDSDQIAVCQTVEHVGNGCYYIETIYIPTIQPYRGSKTGTKVAEYITSGTTIFTLSVTGTFSYDGSTATATSASGALATHVPNATINSRRAYTSGASACAFGSVSYNGATLQKTVTLTCDKNGNLS